MLYKPPAGKFKDNCILHHQGVFHCFSMYQRGDDPERLYNSIWHAVSGDGVHWQDAGMAVERAPFLVWAMKVHRARSGRFILNHGSFGASGAQNTLRLWESEDLYRWELRPDLEITAPTSPAGTDTRLDCMSVIEWQGRYFGYATGEHGFLHSEDGEHFEFCHCDFDTAPLPPFAATDGGFEVGDVVVCGDRVFYLGGAFGYLGRTGYGVYTMRAPGPSGPFRPDLGALRLSGNSDRWVNLWARCFQFGDGLLSHSYMQEGCTYECGDTWLPPLRRAGADAEGHFRLSWWEGNEALKGEARPLRGLRWETLHADHTRVKRGSTGDQEGVVAASLPGNAVFEVTPPAFAAVTAPLPLDAERGVVVDGTLTLGDASWVIFPAGGLWLEEDDTHGTAIVFDSCGRTSILAVTTAPELALVRGDVVDYGCAAPCGMTAGVAHRFRLLLRRGMFEVYLDDQYVQTFNTAHRPDRPGRIPRRFGIASCNGACTGSDITMYRFR